MTREKREIIIREFERFVQEYSVEYTDYNEEVLQGVLVLLKAQEPVKPKKDAVEVVRCKDCKYAHMTYDGEAKYCDIISMPDADGDYGYALYLPGDWYCADGERREENDPS